ncbi:zf-HC2 domain-containing protein [Streptomyces sp. Rer75]|uniref:zf-HC2 domain-containing protein n=1 Tax=Streptomyces sp. Rer75 TaxID=2750011 RepID=UPI0015CF92BA|nr:zf-HC2 domain-containing protein [Streptomyces sp. Rer75]QLH25370.1 zf-HC2 domain-containing protein [Streptomyces sp. Rer75]
MTADRMPASGSDHPSHGAMVRYVLGTGAHDPHVPRTEKQDAHAPLSTGALWTVEAHLEQCGICQAEVAEVVRVHSPATMAVVDGVRERLAASLPTTRPRRWSGLRSGLARWAPPVLGPWVMGTVLVTLLALILSSAAYGGSLVLLLLAPLMPLLGVAASWGPHSDPSHELAAATPRTGLSLVLRRTVAVLAVVIPALLIAGWACGTAPALILLPALALTSGSLALGSVVGMQRAATGLSAAWAAFVTVPALNEGALPPYLGQSTAPGWTALAIVLSAAVVLRRDAYLHPREGRARLR